MRVTGEIRERYGRDENNPSRAQTPLYKGYPSDDGRDEGIFIASCTSCPTSAVAMASDSTTTKWTWSLELEGQFFDSSTIHSDI